MDQPSDDGLDLIDGIAWVQGCKHNTPQGRNARYITAAFAALEIAEAVRHRGCVVQGGGWIGLWPRELARWFDRVVTREPDPTNYAALQRNIAGLPQIDAWQAAYGATVGTTGLTRPQGASGEWRCDGPGDVPVVTIDGLGIGPVDAIVLDVEGSELAALQGAEATISRDRPVIWLEYHHHRTAIAAWLQARGYRGPIPTRKADVMFVQE